MKITAFIVAAGLLWPASAHGQVTISAGDLSNQAGQYYRAYANKYNPLTASSGFNVGDIAGSAGPGRFWDFSKGPKERVFRFDYLAAAGLGLASEFPEAKMAERKTDESDNSVEWLFFTEEPGVGRRVYGFYAELPFITPLGRFVPPMVDFPAQIAYEQEWSSRTTYQNAISFFDPDPEEGGLFSVKLRNTQSSHFKVDAYGTIVLPNEMGVFGEGLRINEAVTLEVALDLWGEGEFDPLNTYYTRNFYWVMPGYGIVAQLNSTQNASPPPDNFARATAFLRMFETNKKPVLTAGCTEPGSVADLRIWLNPTTVLLVWSKAECASQYRVESTPGPFGTASWSPLGEWTTNTFWQVGRASQGTTRFYRVISVR